MLLFIFVFCCYLQKLAITVRLSDANVQKQKSKNKKGVVQLTVFGERKTPKKDTHVPLGHLSGVQKTMMPRSKVSCQ